ncbi:CPBP family intramembrane metalloprotease [Alteromonadaceae bacterium BrNp21-10]|nr:CPBP family intramembrane metalloprotease [Alteromonadaceae bacterium BrNp21-10]
MAILEYLLWSYFLGYPFYIYFTHEAEKQRVLKQPALRIRVYRETMLHIWVPVLVLLLLVTNNVISLGDIGWRWQWNLANQLASVGLVALSAYFLYSIGQVKRNLNLHPEIRKQFTFIQWFMPSSKREFRYVFFGVSVSAGICEELLFRGYLISLLNGVMPTYASVLLSSLAFGLMHIYQGPLNVLRTASLGGILAGLYLLTDSIVIPIILHVLLDMYGAGLAYIVFKNEPQKHNPKAAGIAKPTIAN